MPELPEIETIKRALIPVLTGKKLTKVSFSRQPLRYPLPDRLVENLTGNYITEVKRRAKYLLISLKNNHTLLLHLGMSGHILQNALPQKHEHMILMTETGNKISFIDPRRFGMIDLFPTYIEKEYPLLKKLGPEPFDPYFTPEYLQNFLKTRSGSIKPLLLNQTLVAGLGNIYASEALFQAKIHPKRAGKSLTLPELKCLHMAIRNVLKMATEAGGSTLKDYRQIDGRSGFFQTLRQIYARKEEPCFICQTPIKQLKQAGRSGFFCPVCQK